MTTAVMPTNGKALSVWGDRSEVRELDTRLREMMPGADKLTTSQRLALAQASLVHGLDPFNGEIWMIPGRGLMIGVKGLRKKAHEQVKGNYWAEFVEITDADYRKRQRIPENALAYECRLFDSENLRTYSETCERLLKAGIPWEAVSQMVGSKPYTVGIGVLAAGEQTKMQPSQCAMKRAEADAIKRRFDVPFGLTVTPDQDAPENGEWVVEGSVVEVAEQAEPQPARPTAVGKEATGSALYPADDDDIPQPPVIDDAPDLSGLVDTRAPAPAATRAPVRASSTASLKISRAKQPTWEAFTRKLAADFPKYAAPGGGPANFHILGAVKKCLFDSVNDENIDRVMIAVAQRAAEA